MFLYNASLIIHVSLIIHKDKTKEIMSVNECLKDTLADAVFYVSNKVNFQNYFANKLIKWFVFETVQKTLSTCFIGDSKTLGYRFVFS